MGTLRPIAALSWLFFLFTAGAVDSASPLQMHVTPTISRAPAWVRVRVMVAAGPDDRMLRVIAESPSYYRASEVPLEGTRSQPLNVFEFKNLPTGTYDIRAVLVDGSGPRASAQGLARVEPGFGS